MRGIFVAIGLLVSYSASANFTGTWSGTGNVEETTTGQTGKCQMKMILVHKANSLRIKEGSGYKCDILERGFQDATAIIKNNRLYLGETKIGSIDNKNLRIKIKTDQADIDMIVQKKNGSEAYFRENLTFDGYTFKTRGNLKKQ